MSYIQSYSASTLVLGQQVDMNLAGLTLSSYVPTAPTPNSFPPQ